ncbi:FadR family transcriptional regulator [Alkalihalobacillus sp. MEB130]|uniref:FadR/GntR family transcriptional regulator n=1 Tax=Alkalihalobacillus sp. MEB130 TaxID=2976704 RepID=UPI0028DFECFB|nr:FadR/GntR family transcriptional regulator [Alkalihalobacillus sp. MEB130]MDT8860056.1 FadR family transcriptional regulator [Alkalihalobacillus sp. MEB130]
MAIEQVRPKKIYEIVAEQLTEMIRSGEVMPGERLSSVQQLAEDFNVGRSAIREALSALKAVGLVEIKQGEGTFVKKIDHDLVSNVIPSVEFMKQEDIQQLFEIRKIVETGAASLAAKNRSQEDLQKMKLILEEMLRAEGDGEIGEKADVEFHMAIVRSTKNDMLLKLLETVSDTMQVLMREARRLFLFSESEKMKQLYDEHIIIFEAIQNNDSQQAYEAMMTHIVGVEKAVFQKVTTKTKSDHL